MNSQDVHETSKPSNFPNVIKPLGVAMLVI